MSQANVRNQRVSNAAATVKTAMATASHSRPRVKVEPGDSGGPELFEYAISSPMTASAPA